MILGGYGVATGGPLAWGLCYNREMSPSQSYCDDYYKFEYPCSPGAEYYGRGALPIYWYVPFSFQFVKLSLHFPLSWGAFCSTTLSRMKLEKSRKCM